MRLTCFPFMNLCLALSLAFAHMAAAQIRTPRGEPITTTGPGPAPTGLTATATRPTSVTVSWNAMSGVRGYLVERRKTSDPACCSTISGALTAPGWTDNGLVAATQYTFRVNVMYTDGRTGMAEVTATTPANPIPGPVPATYGGTVTQNVVSISWSPVPGASEYSVLRDGVEVSRGGACSPTCIVGDTRSYGSTSSYSIQTRFPTTSNLLQSQSPSFNVLVPHMITVAPPGYYLVARDSRVDFQITNTANPDGSRGALVTGSGNGVTVTDPGLNKLALTTTPAAPLGAQRIALSAANTAPAFVDAIVMRTPGRAGLALPGIASVSPPGTASTLRVEQLGGPRWAATFNSLPRIEFERDGDFGGAAFCATSDAVGAVLSANGKKLGLTSPWGIVLQELNRSPVPAPHVLEASRLSADGRIGLVPLIYLTPDCTLAVIVDISDNTATPYRIRTYDLLTRQLLGTDTFGAAAVSYDIAIVELFAGDNSAMTLSVRYPGKNQIFSIPHRSF